MAFVKDPEGVIHFDRCPKSDVEDWIIWVMGVYDRFSLGFDWVQDYIRRSYWLFGAVYFIASELKHCENIHMKGIAEKYSKQGGKGGVKKKQLF